jgi:transcriptional regulator with XRE-family HTH domain
MYPNLKWQLWKSGLRQNRLARMLEIDETVLSKILNGFRQPSPCLQQRIAQVLECDQGWLFERMDDPNVASPSRRGTALSNS